jgi:hypothetical protein
MRRWRSSRPCGARGCHGRERPRGGAAKPLPAACGSGALAGCACPPEGGRPGQERGRRLMPGSGGRGSAACKGQRQGDACSRSTALQASPLVLHDRLSTPQRGAPRRRGQCAGDEKRRQCRGKARTIGGGNEVIEAGRGSSSIAGNRCGEPRRRALAEHAGHMGGRLGQAWSVGCMPPALRGSQMRGPAFLRRRSCGNARRALQLDTAASSRSRSRQAGGGFFSRGPRDRRLLPMGRGRVGAAPMRAAPALAAACSQARGGHGMPVPAPAPQRCAGSEALIGTARPPPPQLRQRM